MTLAEHGAARARSLEIEPDPVAIAQRCQQAGLGQLMLLHSAEPSCNEQSEQEDDFGRYSYIAAAPDRISRRIDPTLDDDPPAQLGPDDPATVSLAHCPRWIGVIPYESRRQLERVTWTSPEKRPAPTLCEPQWYRYPALVRVDHRSGSVAVVGTEPKAIEGLVQACQRNDDIVALDAVELTLHDDEPPELHLRRIERAKRLIIRGDLYQVNVARRIGIQLRSGCPLGLYQSLIGASPTKFCGLLELGSDVTVLSTTPELLLYAAPRPKSQVSGNGSNDWPCFGSVVTEPIKGTRPRGRTAVEDQRHVHELDADPKERAELAMIVDVERNDVGKVCKVGTVEVSQAPRVVTHPTVHHRKARVVGQVRHDLSREDVLKAIVPSGSVTGAPKVRAMEVIAQLEAQRRGLYTGGLGYVSHDGSVVLAMAIRTAVLRANRGVYWTGGGIVADSNPERELAETSWKAAQLLRAAGQQV